MSEHWFSEYRGLLKGICSIYSRMVYLLEHGLLNKTLMKSLSHPCWLPNASDICVFVRECTCPPNIRYAFVAASYSEVQEEKTKERKGQCEYYTKITHFTQSQPIPDTSSWKQPKWMPPCTRLIFLLSRGGRTQ